MNQAPESLITDRLILRRPSLSDAAAIFEYGRDPEVTRYMDWPRHTGIQDAVEFLEGCASRWKSGEEFCWVVTVKPEDEAIGTIACRVAGDQADFGYVLNRKYWGKGYATEAAQAVLAWVISLPAVAQVWATCDTENLASYRVLEKTGLSCKKTLHCATIRPNLPSMPRDTFIFTKARNSD